MDCERTEQLIPSAVGDDLDGHDLVAVRAHVAACERCARLADDYREIVAFARQHTEPDAGPEYYESIRREVLSRVSAPATGPTWVRPVAIAASVALVGLVALLLALALGTGPVRRSDDVVREEVVPPADDTSETPEPRREEPRPRPDAKRQPRMRQAAYRPARRRAEPAPKTVAGPADMLTIEFQTSDPNVRIIWFVPQEDGAPSDKSKIGA